MNNGDYLGIKLPFYPLLAKGKSYQNTYKSFLDESNFVGFRNLLPFYWYSGCMFE
jgi:hypothetical protein